MKIHQLRNATIIVHLNERRLLIDPMLGDVGAFRGFKRFGPGKRPNPLVPLAKGAHEALEEVTDCVITHCQRGHLDHIDPDGAGFLTEHDIPVWSVADDFAYLREQGLAPRELVDGTFGMTIRAIDARHGHGPEGDMLGPGHGWYIAAPNEPSLYLTGDTVLIDAVRTAIAVLKPDVIVAPAGCANFGQGQDILFPLEELVELARLAPGIVVFNHMEALDHCPTTRQELRILLEAEGVGHKCRIPEDGEMVGI
ncbi:MBL fold metallo-hydrolase [Pseudodesulfovibrio cashew]|nr:MBL fold metallo-hydrolase [Pseudodesulfovibrio cashew]